MNVTHIIGNLTSDPEIRTVGENTVCSFGVAVNGKGRNAQATFFRVSVWNKLGELCAQYLAKGRKVACTGEVSAHAYKSSNGDARASLDLTARDVEFLSPREQQGDAYEPPVSAAPVRAAAPEQVVVDDLPF